MYWSEVLRRDIVDMDTGVKLGTAADVDFVLDEKTGAIRSLSLPERSGPFGLFKSGSFVNIPWSAVHRFGRHVILVRTSTGRRSADSDAPPVG